MRRAALILTMSLMVFAAACSDPSSSAPRTGRDASEPTTLTVFAASSLGSAFQQITDDFEAAHEGVTVTLNLGSSTDLAAQIASEGTADVFASASGTAMDSVEADPGADGRTDFATNRLVIITPNDDPARISSIADLAKPGVLLVLGAEGVPVGDYAREALDNAGISDAALANVVSNEQDDASVVAKIVAGEADAAIVYTSDVASGADVRAVDIPDAVNVIATYPIAVVTATPDTDLAQAFVDAVTGPNGQATLKTYGFGPPPAAM
jgi:molybdate transport system substrate-binding protein